MSAIPSVHSSHCCPVHGCKYGDEHCPVATGQRAPSYPLNNGCEGCELKREEGNRFWGFNDEELDEIRSALSRTRAGSSLRTKLWNEALDVLDVRHS